MLWRHTRVSRTYPLFPYTSVIRSARLAPCWRLGRAQLSRAPRGAADRRIIETERLVMRSWRDEDIAPFQRICSDPEVMATLGPPLDLDAAAARIGWMREHEDRKSTRLNSSH